MPIYASIFDGPARNYRRIDGRPVTSVKKYQTVHATANDASAQAEANYAQTRTDGTSSHYYADNIEVIQSLNTDWCAGHVGSYEGNTFGISWEFTGVNAWSRQQWLDNIAWRKVAVQMAEDCRNFTIPPRLLTVAEMRAGSVKGFITHDLARLAWGKTDHTDPGPNFPMDHLLTLVAEQLSGDDMAGIDPQRFDDENWKVDALLANTDVRGGAYQGHPDGKNGLKAALEALAADVAELKARPPVVIDQAMLEAALRKVIGSVDGATP